MPQRLKSLHNMEQMRASIVIPAFNEEKNLARVLPLVRQQLGPADEVLVVDNASTDRTASVARSFNAEVVLESNRGRGRARNAGLKRARGEYIVFLDADCLPQAGWLQSLIEPFDDPKVGCVGGEIINAKVETPLGKYLAAKGHLSQRVTFAHSFLPFAQSGNVAFRRSVFQEIGGFDHAMPEGEDADLCWRMQLQTQYRIVCVPDAVVLHMHDLSLRDFFRQKRRHASGAVLLFKKYRVQRRSEQPTLKRVYWEYTSIVRRSIRYILAKTLSYVGVSSKPDPDRGYQLLVEVGEKLGRLEGSLRHRAWYL
jgi:cellulose synthase/poly-beta-1,6-N-acetylglucosamine synthase-like glycosyltransferase